ncbi:DUF3667 domain-containing protein [Mucilaginibacter sp.]
MHPEERHPLKHMTHEALHDLIHFDTKIFKTLPVLIFKPGKLTESAFDGNADPYVKPVTLFVFLNFLFFIVKFKGIFSYMLPGYQSQFGNRIDSAMAELHLSLPLFTERFNTAMHFEQKEYFVIMVPLFALMVQLLYFMQRRHFVQHLVFALHFYAFFIVYLMVIPYMVMFGGWLISICYSRVEFMHTEEFLTYATLAISFTYLLFAVRRFYRKNWLTSIIKSALLSYGVLLLIVYIFRSFLFFAVMHSITEI